jgi:hypothetical protein
LYRKRHTQKVSMPDPECAIWLHKLMTKGPALVNAACCTDRDEEEEDCINVTQCNGTDDDSDGAKGRRMHPG